ncbi:putative enoyl-CoA hydratase 1 [Gandjariella thermophila]|uniref:Putative enoyl-CoA hydratase 1 n=1 Tax=Gandjariella thermophila TaxID=1931992 RepID=A0A4D4JER9_9PSEU|nr:putative enoyl-CoA hydratase 1 [Gandjariella thermophila]
MFAGPTELPGAAGQRLGVSAWRPVAQAQIDRFAELTGDDQWIHVDPRRAAAGPFGGTIAHGYLVLALLTPMLDEIFRVDGVDMALNKGLDAVRFRGPVPAGSLVRAAADLVSATPGLRGYVEAVIGVTVEVEGQRRPACTAHSHVLYHGAEVVASP